MDHLIFEATVPRDHYLRRVLHAIDFPRFRPVLACVYDPGRGRLALEPLLLLELEFLQYHYNLSDRAVVDQARYNLAFRLLRQRRAGGVAGRRRLPRRGVAGVDPARGAQVEVDVPAKAQPATGLFPAERFRLDGSGQTLTCPAGQTTDRKRPSYQDTGWPFRFSRPVWAGCRLLGQCVARLPQTTGRAVIKAHHEKEYQAARAKAQTEAYRAVRREHPAIEGKLGEMVRWHRARWPRERGKAKVLLQGLLVGLVVNVKRLVALAAGVGKVRGEMAATG